MVAVLKDPNFEFLSSWNMSDYYDSPLPLPEVPVTEMTDERLLSLGFPVADSTSSAPSSVLDRPQPGPGSVINNPFFTFVSRKYFCPSSSITSSRQSLQVGTWLTSTSPVFRSSRHRPSPRLTESQGWRDCCLLLLRHGPAGAQLHLEEEREEASLHGLQISHIRLPGRLPPQDRTRQEEEGRGRGGVRGRECPRWSCLRQGLPDHLWR